MHQSFLTMPQWTTGPRLLQLGEQMTFDFFLPAGTKAGDLVVFPRYLERAEPGAAFVAGGGLDWLDDLDSESIPLDFSDGWASASYRPTATGSYLARWTVGGESLYRYFAAVDDDYIVARLGGYPAMQRPTWHATGIPMDYPLAVEPYTDPTSHEQYRYSFNPDDPLYRTFLRFHRQYGDLIAAQYPDTPELTQEERVREYGRALEKVRRLLPDQNDARCGRVEMWHGNDPGYGETLGRIGIESHFGLQMSNGGAWLGMPEFPYFASPVDLRKTHQGDSGPVVVHQWDFTSGWHFLGPVNWHSQFDDSENHWDVAEHCLLAGIAEAANLARMNDHPAFIFPLFDGAFTSQVRDGELVCPMDDANWGPDHPHYVNFRFVERYQRFLAFEMPKAHKLVYARSLDVADYYRRHFTVTPRTVFVSSTDHIFYDMNWINGWAGTHILLTRERLPWNTRIPPILDLRKTTRYGGKDPLSYEYIVVEDQRRSVRFEREALNPIWWFDYTNQEAEIGPDGSQITHVDTPDVAFYQTNREWSSTLGIDPSRPPTLRPKPMWIQDADGLTISLRMLTDATFPDYAIALWELPEEFAADADPTRIRTNAKDVVVARNTDGETHLVLFFDLSPDFVLSVTLGPR